MPIPSLFKSKRFWVLLTSLVAFIIKLTLRREGNRVHLMQRVKSSAQCPQIKFRF